MATPAAGLTAPPVRSTNAVQAAIDAPPLIALIGNPNTGKSTLFNALTGLRQKIANYPGVTVEWHLGEADILGTRMRILDLPGTYSLTAQSPDEFIAVNALVGRLQDLDRPQAILVVVDASNLQRNLFLVTQLLELGQPIVVALNMSDLLPGRGLTIDPKRLADRLGVPVIPIAASKGTGLDPLYRSLIDASRMPAPPPRWTVPSIADAAARLIGELHLRDEMSQYEASRALIDEDGDAQQRLIARHGERAVAVLGSLRDQVGASQPLAAVEARERYRWIAELVAEVQQTQPMPPTVSDRLDRMFGHPLVGSLLFLGVMTAVFQAVFAWAIPLMQVIDVGASRTEGLIHALLPDGAIASLLAEGVVAGVGSVVVFLPQILILFAFIILLEDTGYMARAAFMMDRLMRWCGLSGQSFIPMLSSFACAVPGIMGTRVISNNRDRIATILAAPFMTCSARLPVYALLISAFVPPQRVLFATLNLQGLALLGLYLLGIVGGVLTAMMLKRGALRGPTPAFVMEMPPYRMPNLKSVALRLWERARLFLIRAGTVIFAVAVIVWALTYFPRPPEIALAFDTERMAMVEQTKPGSPAAEQLSEIANKQAAAYLEQSWMGRAGKAIEPLFAPLGWDWRVSAAVVASFPAREVVIAVLGTIYAVGADTGDEDRRLIDRIKSSRHADGSLVYTPAMALGLMVFYAFCLQCAATVATIWRETGSWRWPAFAWTYMTGLAYIGALLCYQIGTRLG